MQQIRSMKFQKLRIILIYLKQKAVDTPNANVKRKLK